MVPAVGFATGARRIFWTSDEKTSTTRLVKLGLLTCSWVLRSRSEGARVSKSNADLIDEAQLGYLVFVCHHAVTMDKSDT
jgi:hypothetical protein